MPKAFHGAGSTHLYLQTPFFRLILPCIGLNSANFNSLSGECLKSKLQKNYFKLLLLHRRIGLALVLVIVWLAFSGVLLNHTDRLGLAEINFKMPWLLSHYGLSSGVVTHGYPLQEVWLAELNEGYYCDGKLISEDYGALVGGVALPDLYLLATADALVLVDKQGNVLEILDELHGLDGRFEKIGTLNAQPVLRSSSADFVGTVDGSEWKAVPARFKQHVSWSEAELLPAREVTVISDIDTGEGVSISLEKLVLDLHSGRFFGEKGWLLLDLFALLLCLGAGTGFFIWLRLRIRW